jgi:hypothetical protein
MPEDNMLKRARKFYGNKLRPHLAHEGPCAIHMIEAEFRAVRREALEEAANICANHTRALDAQQEIRAALAKKEDADAE